MYAGDSAKYSPYSNLLFPSAQTKNISEVKLFKGTVSVISWDFSIKETVSVISCDFPIKGTVSVISHDFPIKGTVSVISCDFPIKGRHFRFTTVPFKPLVDTIYKNVKGYPCKSVMSFYK